MSPGKKNAMITAKIAIWAPVKMVAEDVRFIVLFTNPSARAGYNSRSIFKRSLTGFNSEFSFSYTSCLSKAEELSLSYYLPIAGGRIIGFIPFPRVLVLCEVQLVSSRIWNRVAVSLSYDDNHYTTGASVRFIIPRISYTDILNDTWYSESLLIIVG